MSTTTITGTAAIEYATRTGAQLHKHADPVDGAREITVDEAREIAREDAGLVWCEAQPVTRWVRIADADGVVDARTITVTYDGDAASLDGDDIPDAEEIAEALSSMADAARGDRVVVGRWVVVMIGEPS